MRSKQTLFSWMGRLALTLALIAVVAMPMSAQAAGRTQHYGPFASSSPDSGTCPNNLWATDTFDRHFTVDTLPNADGTYTIQEQFKNGSFVTNAGMSPGGCETNPGGTLLAGVTGTMQGSFTIVVSGGTYNPNATCPAVCTTAGFVTAVFGPTATYNVPTYRFEYTAGGQGLASHTWKNASADRGGDQGDISNT